MTVTKFIIIITVLSTTFLTGNAVANNTILVQSTTSTKNSGLYDHILPLVKQDTGVTVNIVAVGTGAAIKNAMNCDGDVLLVHVPAARGSVRCQRLFQKALRCNV